MNFKNPYPPRLKSMVEERSSKLHQFIKPKAVDLKKLYWRSWIVRHLKILFPIFAGVTLAFIFFWPSFKTPDSEIPQVVQEEVAPHDLENNSAREMSFTTEDKAGNPIHIVAQKGIELDLQQVLLTHPILSLTHSKAGIIKVKGTEGIYRPLSQEMILKGDVQINHPEGHCLKTSSVVFKLDENMAHTLGPATLLSPLGKIEAREVELFITEKKLILKGRPVITFFKEKGGK